MPMFTTARFRGKSDILKTRAEENRRSQRYQISVVKAIALSFDDVGRIRDISTGGFSAEYFNASLAVGDMCTVSIFEVRDKFYLKDIPVKLSWVATIQGLPPASMNVQVAGVQFLEISDYQRAQIQYFIDWHNTVAKGDFSQVSVC